MCLKVGGLAPYASRDMFNTCAIGARDDPGLPYCRECGAKIVYDRNTRSYVCPGCGLIYTPQDLVVGARRDIEMDAAVEKKRRKYAEYLEWWTSSKK